MDNDLRDLKDGKEWSGQDIDNLRQAVERGFSLRQAGRILCRSTSIDEVREKAGELGLKFRRIKKLTANKRGIAASILHVPGFF